MEKTYRIFSKLESPRVSHADFFVPKTVYTLIGDEGQAIRTSLPRRSTWEVGDTVKIDDSMVLANLVE